MNVREALGRLVFAVLGRRRFHRLIGLAQAAKAGTRPPAEIAAIADTIERFHALSYEGGALDDTYWMGVPLQKSPLDCWVYQEILFELRPDLIIETGTYLGGSALYFAQLCDLLGRGRVITIDLQRRGSVAHPRVTQLAGDALDPAIVARVATEAASATTVLVVLDDDHGRDHVLRELRTYGPLVTRGSYLVVEDTNVNGHPVMPAHGPGPMEAVEAFLAEDDRFTVDRSREKFLLTYFPGGWLKRR